MELHLEFKPYTLHFRFNAGTSRGVLKEKKTWLLKVFNGFNPKKFGLGECGPLDGLSIDDVSVMEEELEKIATGLNAVKELHTENDVYKWVQELVSPLFPSIRFGLEMALLDLVNGGERMIFDTPFYAGTEKIPINGLIWMGDRQFMLDQVKDRLSEGFGCVKMKIGAEDWAHELEVLQQVRMQGDHNIVLRVDANGALPNNQVLLRLKDLELFDLHSIEQPIMPRQPEAMSLICEKSPVPVALDEDLIGLDKVEQKAELLDYVKPQYIVLKPTLIGGIQSTMEWVSLADQRGIGWWITSALESNIGLNAISQLTSKLTYQGHQGLGTGQLYRNNIASPLQIEDGCLSYSKDLIWGLNGLF